MKAPFLITTMNFLFGNYPKMHESQLAHGFRFCSVRWKFIPKGFDAARFARVVVLGMVLSHICSPNTATAATISSSSIAGSNASEFEVPPIAARIANFEQEAPSPASRKLADWVMNIGDNGKLPFVIVDKVSARVFVFNAEGQLKGASSILLGLAVGDDSVPGIGQRKLSSIRPNERTTPAGRFVASLDHDIHGVEILWVDYDTAISLHAVVKGTPQERRAARLASPSVLDKRISYGCINVPVKFYEQVVSPIFTGTNGIVYILPETRSAEDVFGLYDVNDSSRKDVLTRSVPPSYSAIK